ncbi:MAG: NAD(+) synthase, partial [Clostridia bacterium]|nr:NAD(+) synthase [Clostridia bacterium]
AAFLHGGKILGFATKTHLPNHSEFFEARYFTSLTKNTSVTLLGEEIPVGPKLLFCSDTMEEFRIAAEICEDLWSPASPGAHLAQSGATVLVNLSASNEVVGKGKIRKSLLSAQSSRAAAGYLYANAGKGESTTDLVFSGHSMIYEDGELLAESKPYTEGLLCTEIDLERITQKRRRFSTFRHTEDTDYLRIFFHDTPWETVLTRTIPQNPFVPDDPQERNTACRELLEIQSHGLQKRLSHIGAKTVTIGISGGLDSTLALLVTAMAFDSLGLSRSGIVAVTMPCFGTSNRTYQNANALAKGLGATLQEINIKASVTQHLADIGADINTHDVTYENAQARERTQVLMDVANKTGGIVIGTGDLSELALGFATYNGDHISMYGVNASIPKTLMRHLVRYLADAKMPELKETLYDILDTPVSPELLPPEESGAIAQQTESIVGPYELHDFFLYYMIQWGFSKAKILHLAKHAFRGTYSAEEIEKWLNIFLRRFFQSQFKRSCLPDGPKATTVSLSPRGDWKMPSDAYGSFND